MPLIGSIFVVIAVAVVGLLAWSLLPKAYDKTKEHFDLDKKECEGCSDCTCEKGPLTTEEVEFEEITEEEENENV